MNSKETKRQLLKEVKAWNLYPENVKAEIFHTHPFFDPEDKVQVKYEMMRARETEGIPLKQVCSQFGFTRESYRHILERFHSEGIGGLFERKRGRQRPVKAKEQIQDYIWSEHFRDKSLTADQLAQHCYQEFGVSISRRTVFRILEKHRRHKKKSHLEIW